jgi:biopolymer transport protein ExbB
MNWNTYVDGLSSLFDKGGVILWAILVASMLLWFLILERYWAYWWQLPELRASLLQEWHESKRSIVHQMAPRRIRALVGELQAEATRNFNTLHALTTILPLLGLLGTVSGMIKVFDVINLFGSGNTRGMAAGISEALVTTMAGLLTALSGVYFVTNLENRAETLAREFETELVEDK